MAHVNLFPARVYYQTFLALAALMLLTLLAYVIPLGAFALPVALAIATCKATLIILIFMNVRFSSSLTMLFVAAGFFWLLILLVFTLSDFVFPEFGTPFGDPIQTSISDA